MHQPLARKEWINACGFNELNERDVLREVSRRVSEAKAKAAGRKEHHPLVLLDLDSTLYEVGTRSHYIFKEWAGTPEGQTYSAVSSAIDSLLDHQVGYSVRDTLRTLGLDLEHAEVQEGMNVLKKFWQDRFFTNEYLPHDRPYPGAARFARAVHELGAEIVYLTGRDEPGMGEATRANLIRDDFPWGGERTHLLMKPAFHLPDLEHKKNAADYIRRHGTLVASFENEPANLIALYDIFPQAMHVFVETVCSDHATHPRQGLYRIRSFQE